MGQLCTKRDGKGADKTKDLMSKKLSGVFMVRKEGEQDDAGGDGGGDGGGDIEQDPKLTPRTDARMQKAAQSSSTFQAI